MAHNWNDRPSPEDEAWNELSGRAERLATALRRVRAIASDALASDEPERTQELRDILSEIQKAGL